MISFGVHCYWYGVEVQTGSVEVDWRNVFVIKNKKYNYKKD